MTRQITFCTSVAAAAMLLAATTSTQAQPTEKAPGECDNPAISATGSVEVAERMPEVGCEVAHRTEDPAMGCEAQDAGSNIPETGRDRCDEVGTVEQLRESLNN